MNVGQLIQRLSTFPADMPVVLAARDEPVGDYEVMTVSQETMAHDPSYDHGHVRVFQRPDPLWDYRHDPAREVVFLDFEGRSAGVVDAVVPVAALETGGQP